MFASRVVNSLTTYMNISLEIPDRLYIDIKSYCEQADLPFDKFIESLISDQFYTLKYGDLNELNKSKQKPKVKSEVKSPSIVEQVVKPIEEDLKKTDKDAEIKVEPIVVVQQVKEPEKPKTKRRILNSK